MLKRAILLVGGPLAAVVVTVATAALLAGDLPDPIASHWNLGGEPDGRTPLWPFVAAIVVAQLLAWGALAWQERSRGRRGLRLTAAPFAWGAIAFLVALALVVLAANADAADWRAADEVGPLAVLIALAAAALGALAGWALERGRPLVEPGAGGAGAAAGARTGGAAAGARTGGAAGAGGAAGGAPAVALAPGERAVWSRGLVSRPLAAVAIALGVALVVAGAVSGGGWLLALGGVAAALAAGTLAEIVVTIDRRGVTIAYGPFGWPRQTVPLADVARAEPTRIDPWRVGGWGYRKVPTRPGVTAVVLRGGDGLRIVRADGRELLVTIPDAAAGAALLEALRD